ncbi:MAG: hypothetical protein KDE47_29300 [Caldilineaceae bacterium]|nr:hypothetical protein [Caldilineaceae bacterium]
MPSIPQLAERAQGVDAICLPGVHLRTYTELNRHVIAAGLTAPYRIWLLCRSLDTDGSGVVSMDALRTAMEALGLGRRILPRLRERSDYSHFLTFHSHKVEYRSLESVCKALCVEPGRIVMIPAASLSGLESFHAQLYAAWIGGQDSLLISREKLEGLFNVSADSLRRWERLTGVLVTYNVVEVDSADEGLAAAHIPQDARLEGDRLGRSYHWEYQGGTYYRTVNRYQAPQIRRGRVGNVRKVAKAVRCVKPVEDHGDGTRRRIFFDRRTTPAGRQHKPGASLHATGRRITTDRGSSNLWQFSRWRPVTPREAFF